MIQRFAVRALLALTLLCGLGLVTTAATTKASAQSAACGSYTISSHKANLVAKGAVVGYAEVLSDGCGNYELHGHLSAIPAGSTGSSYLLLESQNDDYTGSSFFTTAPQDLYLPEPRNFSPSLPKLFEVVDAPTNVSYEVSF